MHMKTVIGLWLISASLVCDAQAASFDCRKAASDVEKMICADSTLSSLDSTLSTVYSKAAYRSSEPATLKAAQRRWLKNTRNVCQTVECVEVAYKQRLLDLRAIRVAYSDLNTAVNATCQEMAAFESYDSPGTCQVTQLASFGSIDASNLHYAQYCLGEPLSEQQPNRCTVSAMALFAQDQDTGMVEMFHEHAADADSYFETPFISSDTHDTLLVAPVQISGTGSFNDNDYFIYKLGRWVPMDSESWLADLSKYIPSGLEIWKGVEPNVASMTASASLYRPGDANCCPSGGTALIDLMIAGNRLSIKTVRIVAAKAESEG